MGLRRTEYHVIRPVSGLAVYALLLWFTVSPGTLRAQDVSRIAVIVNDEIISVLDLASRIDLTIFAANFPNTADTRRRISGQVLRSLVDERLQLQEAARLGVRTGNREIDGRLGEIERQNGVPRGGLDEMLRQRGVKKSSLVAQLQAQITWTKTLQQQMRRQIAVSDEEVDEELQRLQTNQGLVQNRVAEILLTFDSPDQEIEVRKAAERLVLQIRGGARFDALARQFSKSASAAAGGELGWVTQGQLDEALEQALRERNPGQITDPIRTFAGYHILKLRDRRTPQSASQNTLLDLHQLVIPIQSGASASEIETKTTLAANTRAVLTSCAALPEVAKSVGSPQSGSLGKIAVKDLPANLRHAVIDLAAGSVSEPIVTPTAVLLLMVCDRIEAKVELPTRREIHSRLSHSKLDLLGRRYLRDLRRSAFVEYRI
jgi:peptidyl-prolyl cis-trans isomerase SurA